MRKTESGVLSIEKIVAMYRCAQAAVGWRCLFWMKSLLLNEKKIGLFFLHSSLLHSSLYSIKKYLFSNLDCK
jgi:hypothetical protein